MFPRSSSHAYYSHVPQDRLAPSHYWVAPFNYQVPLTLFFVPRHIFVFNIFFLIYVAIVRDKSRPRFLGKYSLTKSSREYSRWVFADGEQFRFPTEEKSARNLAASRTRPARQFMEVCVNLWSRERETKGTEPTDDGDDVPTDSSDGSSSYMYKKKRKKKREFNLVSSFSHLCSIQSRRLD